MSKATEEMVAIWRETCCPPLPDIRVINQTRRRTLAKRLKEDFGGELEQWRAFCRRIKAAPYLTGVNKDGWVAPFDWVLKPANLNKILEGNYDPRAPRSGRSPNPQPGELDYD